MSTATLARPASAKSIGFTNILLSEWTKLRTVRSTYWTAIAAFMLSLFATGMSTYNTMREINHGFRPVGSVGDPANDTLLGLYIGAVLFGVLGVLAVSSEYGTGMIRAALTAVPQRRTFLIAKGTVLALAALVLGELLSFASFFLGQAFLNHAGVGLHLSSPHVVRAVIGGGLYLTAFAMIGYGFGALVRRTAGGLSAFFLVIFALNPITDLLPTAWRNDIMPYLPLNAGSQILTTVQQFSGPGPGPLSPWAGLGVLYLYAVVPIVAAVWLINHRDA